MQQTKMAKDFKKLDKIVVNVGTGRLSSQPNFQEKILPEIMKDLAAITGQKPSERPAKKSIAGFKLREGIIVGLKVTLRKKRMTEFFEKLINTTLPRVRDFRGINKKALDRNGNLTIGIKEHLIFPEMSSELSKVNFGLEITFVPKPMSKEKALQLYSDLGIPFSKK